MQMFRMFRRAPAVRDLLTPSRVRKPYVLTQPLEPLDIRMRSGRPSFARAASETLLYGIAFYLWWDIITTPLGLVDAEELESAKKETEEKKEKRESKTPWMPLWFPTMSEGKPITKFELTKIMRKSRDWRQKASEEFCRTAVDCAHHETDLLSVTGIPLTARSVGVTWMFDEAVSEQCVQPGFEWGNDGFKIQQRIHSPQEGTRLMRAYNYAAVARALYYTGKTYAQLQWVLVGVKAQRWADGEAFGQLDVDRITPHETGGIKAMKIREQPLDIVHSEKTAQLASSDTADNAGEIRLQVPMPSPILGKMLQWFIQSELNKVYVPNRGSVPATARLALQGPKGSLNVVAKGLYDPVAKKWCEVLIESEQPPHFSRKFGSI